MRFRFHFGYFCIAILLFLVEIMIAKYMRGWIRGYLGDILVVMLIYSTLMTVFDLNKKSVVLFTLIFAFIIEYGQYFKLAELLGFEKGSLAYIVLGNTEPPRDCRRLNFLREYDNENTKLYPRDQRTRRSHVD